MVAMGMRWSANEHRWMLTSLKGRYLSFHEREEIAILSAVQGMRYLGDQLVGSAGRGRRSRGELRSSTRPLRCVASSSIGPFGRSQWIVP